VPYFFGGHIVVAVGQDGLVANTMKYLDASRSPRTDIHGNITCGTQDFLNVSGSGEEDKSSYVVGTDD